MGLILYGLLKGVSSLRGLEELARLDLGGMWISGGLCPDHATFGRFIQRHDEQITGGFVAMLTKAVLKHSEGNVTVVAGDGTVIEAAVSRYGNLKQEALESALREAREKSSEASPKAQQRVEQLKAAREELARRAESRRSHGKDPGALQINPVDPEAMVQPQKDKTWRASYKPSVLANEQRIVVGWGVDAGSETAVAPLMLEQAGVLGELKTVLFDTGYHCGPVIDACARRELELLCPEGRLWREEDSGKRQSGKHYPKSCFHYDAKDDSYCCPAGERLRRVKTGKGRGGKYVVYRGTTCAACSQRAQCTSARNGRTIKRYGCDDAKDAMRQALEDPETRKRYRHRQAMVEPVFSALRDQQNLRRFRRRGLAGVRREFALHVMAYNLGRLLALCPYDPFYAVFMQFKQRYQGGWKFLSVWFCRWKKNRRTGSQRLLQAAAA